MHPKLAKFIMVCEDHPGAKLNPEFKAAWLAALRSGEYTQGRDVLMTPGDPDRHCCLGVACVITKREIRPMQSLPESADWRSWGFTSRTANEDIGGALAGMNDGIAEERDADNTLCGEEVPGLSFAEIADAIEKHL